MTRLLGLLIKKEASSRKLSVCVCLSTRDVPVCDVASLPRQARLPNCVEIFRLVG